MASEIDIQKLDTREKLDLMESLWQELCADQSVLDLPGWHQEVLTARLQAVEDGSMEYIDFELAKQQIADQIK